MIEWLWLLFGGPIVALIIRWFIKVPGRPKLLHTPYARPGPWHVLKILTARVWLAWRLVRHPRVLNVYDPTSKKYEKLGIVATELEKTWELPHKLENFEAMDGMFLYGTDGKGTFLKVFLNRMINRQAQVSVLLILPNGTSYQLPNAPDTLVSNTDGRDSFNAAGLKFQMLEAMRRWRVVFNGTVMRTAADGTVAETHLRINVIWTAFSRPFEVKREFSRKLLASGMARELWRGRKDWSAMSDPLHNGMDQWGVMFGSYQDGDQAVDTDIYLRGLRQRRWGQSNPTTLHRKLDIIGTCEDGNYFYVSAVSDSERLTHEVWGHVYHPSGFLYKINACNLDLEKLGENGPVPHHFSLRFGAKRRNYHALINLMPAYYQFNTGRPWRHSTTVHPCHLTLNARQGRVFFMATKTFHGHCPLGGESETSLPYLCQPTRSLLPAEAAELVLRFDQEACRFEATVGGKGASLALLSSHQDQSSDYTVPTGFCVTVAAWQRQLAASDAVQAAVMQLEKVARGLQEGDLQEHCQKTAELMAAAPVDATVRDSLRQALQEMFGDRAEQTRFAVRSSAVGEDGDDLSSAGQNATILGCRGLDAVVTGLAQCWASLFAFQSVEYRRQHGQPLVPGMGVVVQEMVASEAAGVLFTVNPVDGNPARMIITANFGLGESVVSARAEPDTVELQRSFDGHVQVVERRLGSKQLTVVMDETGATTREVETSTDRASTACLSDAVALRLGRLGVHLERVLGGARDIEFAVVGSDVYLLQARPITALDAWTDKELRREFDTAVLTDEDYVTQANTGEVCPGAAPALVATTTYRSMELNWQSVAKKMSGRLMELNPWYVGRFFSVHQNQMFINVIEAMLRDVDEEIGDAVFAVDLAVFGHIVTTQAMHRLGVQRYGVAGLRRKYHRYRTVFRDLFFGHRRVKKVVKKFGEYGFFAEEFTDAAELYDEICTRMPALMSTGQTHVNVSRAATLTQLIAFLILLDGRREWTPELYAEMAPLFESIANVESAEVPVALKQIARAIAHTNDDFATLAPEAAAEWLQKHSGPAGRLFCDFLKRHGHRSLREFNFRSLPWSLNPRPVVSVLQSMMSNPDSFKMSDDRAPSSSSSNDDWLNRIKAYNTFKYRALKFVVPRCRTAVTSRETTKSVLIRTIHVFRMAYRRLAELLVADGRLPDADLIFFFTHTELNDLVRGSATGGLVAKAVRRRRIHPQLDELVFPEISLGVPRPVEDSAKDDQAVVGDGLVVCGTPVYRGVVRGTVRVALDLEQARSIGHGDILVTRSTDIGWSPYFPLLKGVVTELGGLISHGAVVAREYGLPCIVGAVKATQYLRSGDLVVLDGFQGTITRVLSAQDRVDLPEDEQEADPVQVAPQQQPLEPSTAQQLSDEKDHLGTHIEARVEQDIQHQVEVEPQVAKELESQNQAGLTDQTEPDTQEGRDDGIAGEVLEFEDQIALPDQLTSDACESQNQVPVDETPQQ